MLLSKDTKSIVGQVYAELNIAGDRSSEYL